MKIYAEKSNATIAVDTTNTYIFVSGLSLCVLSAKTVKYVKTIAIEMIAKNGNTLRQYTAQAKFIKKISASKINMTERIVFDFISTAKNKHGKTDSK